MIKPRIRGAHLTWLKCQAKIAAGIHFNFMKLPETQRSIRVAMPEELYNELKAECSQHGEISQLIRKLLLNYLHSLSDKQE